MAETNSTNLTGILSVKTEDKIMVYGNQISLTTDNMHGLSIRTLCYYVLLAQLLENSLFDHCLPFSQCHLLEVVSKLPEQRRKTFEV